jgi:hypothetical protein
MTNYTSQVIETVTLSNTIELTDEQLEGVVGGREDHDHDHDYDHDDHWDRWHDYDDHHPDWGWR